MLLSIMIKFLIILIFLFNLIGGLLYARVKIIFPFVNRMIFYCNKIHIIGLVDRKDKIYLKINKNPPIIVGLNELKKITTKDGTYYLFIKRVNINRGMNYINVKSNTFEKSFYLECFENHNKSFKEKVYFHMNEKAKLCQKCHDFNNIKECKLCHIKFLKAKYVHGPVVTWQCFICHDKNNYFSEIQPVYVRCLKCHQEFSENMYNAKYAHPPALTGNCGLCHTPHISKYKFFTKEDVDKICLKCHENKISRKHVYKNKNYHQKVSCVNCHNPHYGESKFLFINNIFSKKKLCLKCHNN